MTTFYIISLISCFISIWILKNSRSCDTGNPILRIWHILLIIISAFVPIWNFVVGLSIPIIAGTAYIMGDLEWRKDSKKYSRIWSFLNKRIP